ncbi:MAG TPA: histidine ammonia-lyase [Pyrinomonadaceae bacterium]|nr:histidine ammonia-lyase [Pyrinomonadaceae bacterium]HMP65054.1 histidine ammonia-lyase [Pyrinomonadaceae bacterium]
MNAIEIDGESLTFERVLSVAYGGPGAPRVELTSDAKAKVERSAAAVDTLLERGEVAYGITTGFGAFKDKIISREQVEELQRNIVLSHSVGVGDAFDTPTVRAIMLIRANTLARGFSGIRLETLELILECLNRGVHPVIPEKGSLGASGDLAPLAHFACVLIGEGKAEFRGDVMPGAEALTAAGLHPVTLKAKEGLALTNGTTVMTAVGLLETARAIRLADLADTAGSLSLEALNGTVSAFDDRIHTLRPHPRQIDTARNLRGILEGSEFVRSFDPTNVQDAYTLRCMPQVHGACRDAVAYAEWLINIELNSVTDNPLIFVMDEMENPPSDAGASELGTANIEVISGGNFHGEPLALAFDYLTIALAELGNISERRIMRLTDEASNAHVLPAFLTEKGGLNSGFMIVQYTAAALCTENKVLAHPASVDTIPSSANVEDHVSMGATAALKLRQVVDNLQTILSLELFCAAQGIEFRKRAIGEAKRLGRGTAPIFEAIRASVPFIERDEYLKDHIDTVVSIAEGFVNNR